MPGPARKSIIIRARRAETPAWSRGPNNRSVNPPCYLWCIVRRRPCRTPLKLSVWNICLVRISAAADRILASVRGSPAIRISAIEILTGWGVAVTARRAMLRPLAGVLLLVLAAAHQVSRADDQPAPPAPASTGPVEETRVTGTPPDLSGHWLAMVWIEKPDKTVVSFPVAWDISVRDGKTAVTHRLVTLPGSLKDAVDKANAAGTSWQ